MAYKDFVNLKIYFSRITLTLVNNFEILRFLCSFLIPTNHSINTKKKLPSKPVSPGGPSGPGPPSDPGVPGAPLIPSQSQGSLLHS